MCEWIVRKQRPGKTKDENDGVRIGSSGRARRSRAGLAAVG